MRMKASEVGDRLRQIAGKRDHRQLMSDDDYFVLRPGPNFDWLMGNPVTTQAPPLAPEGSSAGDGRREVEESNEVIEPSGAALKRPSQ